MRNLSVGSFLLFYATAASAQTSQAVVVPDLQGQTVECSAFRHEADESWTALKTLPIQRQNEFAQIAAGTHFQTGGPKIAGIDVAAMLSAPCPH